MDFIVHLPENPKTQKDAIVVFVERLSKMVHLEVLHCTATAPDVARIFLNTVYKHHGLPETIVCDGDVKFTSNFWKTVFKLLGTKIAFSTAYHHQTDGQTERAN